MDKAIGIGYGKLILFGEHFVVYGLPGIASGIDKKFELTIEKINEKDTVVEDNVFYYEKVKLSENPGHVKFKVIEPILKKFNISGIKLTFNGDIASKGMGLSAAYAVATARAISELNDLNLTDDEINELAYECEKVSHGTPSGIDNTCATFGKAIWFEKQEPQNKIELLKVATPLYIVIGDTGIRGTTKEIVAGVRERKEENEEEFEEIFQDEVILVNEAKQALEEGDIKMLGELMNNNQVLLRDIGVSCDELEELIEVALENGALGAKLSGAGKGGIIIALAENEEVQEKIVKAIQEKGFKAIGTIIG